MKDFILVLLVIDAILLATACFMTPSVSVRLHRWFQKESVAIMLCYFTLLVVASTIATYKG